MPELIWDGKYGKDGRRTAPPRIALPFQTVETVNESTQERQRSFDLFSSRHDPEWRNRLIWGDKKYVLPALLEEFAGKIDLIYIDPPFASGQNFSMPVFLGEEQFMKVPSMIEVKAYRDTWGRGFDSYLRWFYETAVHLRELLTEDGSLYAHLDGHVGHYVKALLDDLFGSDHFRNEIAWCYGGGGAPRNYYPQKHDMLLWYSNGHNWIFNRQYRPYTEGTSQRGLTQVKGEQYKLREEGAGLDDWWADKDVQKILSPTAYENLKFPTQKPESLLRRIVAGHSDPQSVVLDCFCGSGTTVAVAEKLNRRWIAADLGRFAIHTTRKRLLSIPNVRPFVVQNLGKYERQAWQVAEFGEVAELAYRNFILELYKAQPLSGYIWLHGSRRGALVHVATVDAPVTVGDVQQILMEYRRVIGTGEGAPTSNRIDILGWDFAFELNEVAKQQAALANVDFHFIRIPREVLEKRAVEQGDIQFFELAALSVDVQIHDRTASLCLTDFVIPVDDVPEDVQRAVTHWTQWIDYWAVDWNFRGDTFHNEWQTYRTRKAPSLQTSATHTYEEPGCYTVVVKVIDILGNDTTKTLTVEVA
ncbi:MAG TPA: DNA methyltransferase [Chloroflexota bacterium]